MGKRLQCIMITSYQGQTPLSLFSPSILSENSVVADLINEENQWDEEKLNQHFLQEDA